jgi:hypothetical protein
LKEGIALSSWAEFKDWLPKLESIQKELHDHSWGSVVSPLLFRGQSNSSWLLNTTLERWNPQEITLLGYYRLLRRIQPQIETTTSRKWDPIDLDLVEEWEQTTNLLLEDKLPYHDYLAFLRHNGFPSPLLDWTKSPYIAAFFAFRNGPKKQAERVSLFAYLELGGMGKSHAGNDPLIFTPHPHIRTHNRHYLQQSRYSVCVQERDNRLYFSEHERAIAISDDYKQKQDVIWKFTIPSSEWRAAFKDLCAFNINPYSLFGSEESLMENLAMLEFGKID